MIAAKQYRYFSPVLDFGAKDSHTGERVGAALHSVALTNTPLMARDVLPLAAKLPICDIAPAPAQAAEAGPGPAEAMAEVCRLLHRDPAELSSYVQEQAERAAAEAALSPEQAAVCHLFHSDPRSFTRSPSDEHR